MNLLQNVEIRWDTFSNFVAFSEYLKFVVTYACCCVFWPRSWAVFETSFISPYLIFLCADLLFILVFLSVIWISLIFFSFDKKKLSTYFKLLCFKNFPSEIPLKDLNLWSSKSQFLFSFFLISSFITGISFTISHIYTPGHITDFFRYFLKRVGPVSVDLRVNRISAISGHLPRLEGRRMRRGASGTPVCACLPNEGDAQRWRLIRQTVIYLQPVPLPKEEKTSQEWLKRINRKDFEPTKNTRVCIKHFASEAFVSQAKGQLISEWDFGVVKSPKKTTKF